MSQSPGSAHGSDPLLQITSAGEPVTLTQPEPSIEPRSDQSTLSEVSLSSEPSDDDNVDKQSVAYRNSRGRKWPPDDVARLTKAREAGHSWEVIHKVSEESFSMA